MDVKKDTVRGYSMFPKFVYNDSEYKHNFYRVSDSTKKSCGNLENSILEAINYEQKEMLHMSVKKMNHARKQKYVTYEKKNSSTIMEFSKNKVSMSLCRKVYVCFLYIL